MVKLRPAIVRHFVNDENEQVFLPFLFPHSLILIQAQKFGAKYTIKKNGELFHVSSPASLSQEEQKVTFNLQIMQITNAKWSEPGVRSESIRYLRLEWVSRSAMIKADKAKNFIPISVQMLIFLSFWTLPKYFHNAHKFVCFMEMVKF